MANADRDNRIEKPRRGRHVWFFATLGSLGFFALIAFLVFDPAHRIRIGVVAGMAALFLTAQWLKLFLRTVNEKDQWLDAARRHGDPTDDEVPEVYYVEVGEARTADGATAAKRFHLGASRTRAQRLAVVIAGIWERHGHEWTPAALDEVAAAFRAKDDELARMAEERGLGQTEVRIQVLNS